MDFYTELAQFNPDPQLEAWVVGTVQTLLADAEKAAQQIVQRDASLHAAQLKIQSLVLELAHLRRMRFGARSEALSPQMRDLFQETLASDIAAAEAELANKKTEANSAQPPAPRPPRQRAGRQPLPDHLPRIEHRHEPESCTCGQCGADLVKIGEDVTEQLDVEPAKFFVHRHIRPKYACRPCETIVAEPTPPAIIDGGMAATGLFVWILVSKYMDHLPLYRLAQIADRSGVILSISTMSSWVGQLGVALEPLVDRLIELLKKGDVIHADETPVKQLDPGSGKTKRAYLWVYRSNNLDTGPPIVIFDYQTGRSGRYVREFLADWQGHLMVDDFAGYKALFSETIFELACMSHVRRKFFDLNEAQPNPIAQEALLRIAALYVIEDEAKNMTVAARTEYRLEKALPLLKSLHAWLLETRVMVANGGGTAKALDYALRRWTELIAYASDGHLPIDNNPVENAIRPIAIGKKNWLFTGSERAGQRAAAIQSLLGTAKLNGLDPAAWLRETLIKLPTCPHSQIDTLLPFRAEFLNKLAG